VVERLLAPVARRWRPVATALDVQRRYSEVHGGMLASGLTLATFLSVFPLILVAIAILGYVSVNNTHVASDVASSLGLRGEAVTSTLTQFVDAARHSRRVTSVVGVAGLLWSGLAVVTAAQATIDSTWQQRGRGLRDKAIGVLWLAGSGALMAVSFTITSGLNFLPALLAPLVLVVGAAFDVGQFLFSFKVLSSRTVGWRSLLPGSILGGVGLQVIKTFGSLYLPHAVYGSTQLYGSLLGVIFAILAWLFLFGRLIVYSTVLNVVLWEREHGTETAEIELPRLPGVTPSAVTRAGEAIVS
jgi:membrane protein